MDETSWVNGEWNDSYTDCIDSNLPPNLTYAALGSRYDITDSDGDPLQWEDFLKRIAKAESGFDNNCVYNETGILDDDGNQAVDEVTGEPLSSIGLFQLSPQDGKVEGVPCCAACETSEGIKNPFNNIRCALGIISHLADRYPDEPVSEFMAHYWSSVRDRLYK